MSLERIKMGTRIISLDDVEYLAGQSSDRMNIILAGMTALLDENNEKVTMLESQNWFQRMSKTISGKNKMTQMELQQNHDKISLYISQAMSELFERNCIDQQIMMSLGTRLNELYADHIQLKQMLGAFAEKLNQKIISVDNFHILETEIEQGVYDKLTPIVAICRILSQLDMRTLNDNRKLDIIERSLKKRWIISKELKNISKYLTDLMEMPENEIGILYMELEALGNNFVALVFRNVIENYHFLSESAKMMKGKELVVESVIQNHQIDPSAMLTSEDVYHEFLEAKTALASLIGSREVCQDKTESGFDDELQKAVDVFLEYSIEEIVDVLTPLAEKEDGLALYLLSFLPYILPSKHVKCKMDDWDIEWALRRSNEDREAVDCLERGYLAGNPMAAVRYAKKCQDEVKAKEIVLNNVEELQKLATEGNPFAQYEYALLCSESSKFDISHEGIDVRELLQKASDQGFWMATYSLGFRCRYGTDGEVDYEKAFKLFSQLNKLDMPLGTMNLADFYMQGILVEENKKKAVALYRKASERGLLEATYELARCYHYGNGVQKDRDKAIELYSDSAPSLIEVLAELADIDIEKDSSLKIFPVKRDIRGSKAAYQLYCLLWEDNDTTFEAFVDLYAAAKCGNSSALYQLACCAMAEDSDNYDRIEDFIPYDLELAKRCLEEAKKYTSNEKLLNDIKDLETQLEWSEIADGFKDITNAFKSWLS